MADNRFEKYLLWFTEALFMAFIVFAFIVFGIGFFLALYGLFTGA